MSKITKTPYLLGGLFVVSSLVFNIYMSMFVFEIKGRIEEFYQKDFVDVKEVSEQLVRDIEKTYGKKLPAVELNIRLSEYSKTGIRYDVKVLYLFLPPKIISFTSDQKRAYLAHEFSHYVLGHIDHQNPSSYSFFGTGDLNRDILADSFALKFSSVEGLSFVIKKLVGDENERKTRLASIGSI